MFNKHFWNEQTNISIAVMIGHYDVGKEKSLQSESQFEYCIIRWSIIRKINSFCLQCSIFQMFFFLKTMNLDFKRKERVKE